MCRIIVYLGLQQCCVHRSVTVCCPLILSRLKSRLLHTNMCVHTTLKFEPNHWIVVRKHFRTLMSSFTEIHKLWKYQFAKEKFPHSFSRLFLSHSFFYPRHKGEGVVCVLCARDIRHRDVLSHFQLRDHWMACNTSASALYRCAAPRMQSRDWFAHWLIHMSWTGRLDASPAPYQNVTG